MNVLVVLKLSLAAFFASFVLERISKNITPAISVALGTAYALCGYAMLFYQNIMWLDMMYLFPLIVLGAYRLIEQNKPVLLFVTLTLAVVFNFYISFMVFLFIIFFFGTFALFYRKASRKEETSSYLFYLCTFQLCSRRFCLCYAQMHTSPKNPARHQRKHRR